MQISSAHNWRVAGSGLERTQVAAPTRAPRRQLGSDDQQSATENDPSPGQDTESARLPRRPGLVDRCLQSGQCRDGNWNGQVPPPLPLGDRNGSLRRHRSFHPAQDQSRQARRVGRRRFRGIGYLVIKNRCFQHNCACWLEEDPSDSTLLVWRSNFQAGIGELSYACSRRSSVEEALRVHGQPGIFNNDQARSSPAKPSPACSSLAARGRSQGLAIRIAYG